MTIHYEQGALTYTYDKSRRDWIVMRLEGTTWVYVRDATRNDKQQLPLFGWEPDPKGVNHE